jgi:predicted component of type VI protein secretion system
MNSNYLELPLQFDGMRFKNAGVYDSVVMQVTSIVSTPRGSVACDLHFGTIQLAPDKSLVELGSIKDDLARNIKEAIERDEPRLIKLNVKVHGGPKPDKSGIAPLKIEITGEIATTGKAFKLEKTLSEDYYRSPFPGRLG